MSDYDDIIDKKMPELIHERMSLLDRAAQFSPYDALSGFSEQVSETARRTDKKIILDEDEKSILDNKLQILMMHLEEEPNIKIIYFIKDHKKSGGIYETLDGRLKKIDMYKNMLILKDKSEILIDDIVDIESDLINKFLDY